MELLTPGIGLLIWQVLIFVMMTTFVTSWIMILKSKTLDSRDRLSWLLGTLFLPIIGPLIYFTKVMTTKKQKSQA